jgi:hypothetical protein
MFEQGTRRMHVFKGKELHATPASARALRGSTAGPGAKTKHEHTATERPNPLKKKIFVQSQKKKNFVQSQKKTLCKAEKKKLCAKPKKGERRKCTQ